MLHWLPQFGLFFITAPFFPYQIKSLLLAKTIISPLLLKNMWPITVLRSIKKPLCQRKADNFDPAVREIKGQDWCRGMQNTHFLPTALLLLSSRPLSLHPIWQRMLLFHSQTVFHILICLYSFLVLPSASLHELFSVSYQSLSSSIHLSSSLFCFFFPTASCFALPLKFALYSVIISCQSRHAMVTQQPLSAHMKRLWKCECAHVRRRATAMSDTLSARVCLW